MSNITPAKISAIPKLPIRGIYYIGQYGTSGYASAAKGYLYHYFSNGLPITWEPLYFDNSQLSDDDTYDVIVKSLIRRKISSYDIVIMHSTPDLWPMLWNERRDVLKNKIPIGYCTWETNRLPKNWTECINKCVSEVWCPSTYNENSFKESGVTKPIRVVPHIFLPRPLPLKQDVKLINNETGEIIDTSNCYTFYTIGELLFRKGIEDALIAYCETFTKLDPVKFIVKVHLSNYSQENKDKCKAIIENVLSKYDSHPEVIPIYDNLSPSELISLHAIGDCYVSLTKSEGFGLTIFDAFNYRKPVIATGYGGHVDFLGKNYPGLVGYTMGNVTGMSLFSNYYTEDQQWAIPDIGHAKEIMLKTVKNR